MGKAGSKSMCGATQIVTQDLNSLAKDTTFTVSQLKRWQTEFMEDCPDGKMTKSIFKDKFGDFFNPNPSSNSDLNMAQLADFVFDRFDSNGDGWISFAEFIRAISSPTRGSLDDKLEWAFAIYDVDRDGFITRDEMVTIVAAIYRKRGFSSEDGHIARRRVDEIFLRMDQDERVRKRGFRRMTESPERCDATSSNIQD